MAFTPYEADTAQQPTDKISVSRWNSFQYGIAANSFQIQNNITDIGINKTNIATINTSIATINTELSTHTAQISTNANAISTLQSEVGNLPTSSIKSIQRGVTPRYTAQMDYSNPTTYTHTYNIPLTTTVNPLKTSIVRLEYDMRIPPISEADNIALNPPDNEQLYTRYMPQITANQLSITVPFITYLTPQNGQIATFYFPSINWELVEYN